MSPQFRIVTITNNITKIQGNETRWKLNRETNSWIPEKLLIKKNISEVTNPPNGWKSEKIYIKRTISFIEPSSESEFAFVRIFVELDSPNSTLTDKYHIDVRADTAGLLDVGPMQI